VQSFIKILGSDSQANKLTKQTPAVFSIKTQLVLEKPCTQ